LVVRWTGLFLIVMTGLGCGPADDLGGDAVTVHTVLRPGESPTTLQPDDARVSRVLAARALFRAGVPFESGAWFAALSGELEIVDLRAGVPTRTIDGHQHGHGSAAHEPIGAIDPHIWLSPTRLLVQSRTIAAALIRLDPMHAEDFESRLGSLTAELEALDTSIAATLAPHRGRSFVVFHPSWGYFADDYGLVQIAIEIDGKEPSDAELTELQQRTGALGITTVFVQPQIAGRSADAVAAAIGARVVFLDPLAPDVITNLGQAAEAIAGSLDG
jgi:zinc transport system substrate-binding protein